MKKFYSVFLAVIMCFGLFCSAALAAESDGDFIPAQGEVIGSLADDEGFLHQEPVTRASGGLPFSMIARNVQNLLTTYSSSGKNFTGGAFDGLKGEGLLIQGTLTHTDGRDIKLGACYYKPSTDEFVSVKICIFASGVQDSAFIPKVLSNGYQYFMNSETYYGHITNTYSSGTVSGTLGFYVSTGT